MVRNLEEAIEILEYEENVADLHSDYFSLTLDPWRGNRLALRDIMLLVIKELKELRTNEKS